MGPAFRGDAVEICKFACANLAVPFILKRKGICAPAENWRRAYSDEAKRRAASEFEKRYLTRVMEKSKGSVSEGARLAGLDRTNFRRLLQRHGLDPATFKA